MRKYAYSIDQEHYFGEYPSRASAWLAGKVDAESDNAAIWTGQIKTAVDTLSAYAENLGERIVEEADLILMDEIAADDVIVELSREQREKLGNLVIDYLREHATWHAWGVVEVQEHAPESM